MGPSRAFSLPSGYAALAFLIAGTACLITAVVFLVFSRDVFDSANFGRRAAQSLSDPGVSRYAATLVADRIIHRKPDLIAFRPMIVSASETVVSSRAFRLIVEQAAVRAHRLALSEGANRVILSLPDLNILVQDAAASANPALAAKIPKSLDSTVARMANGRLATAGLRLARAGKAVRWLWAPLFVLAIVLYVLAHLLAPDRRRAMAVAGAALVFAGLLLVGMVAANPIAAAWIHDPIQLGLVRGLWRAYLGDLARLGIIVAGIGLLVAAGASSLLERIDPFERIREAGRKIATPPQRRSRRFGWGAGMFVAGCCIFANPALAASGAAVIGGLCVAYIGARELFRMFLEAVEAGQPTTRRLSPGGRRPAIIAVSLVVGAVCGAWILWRTPAVVSAGRPPSPAACNGYAELCNRPLDQVVFAGAHNAMSHRDAPGWMFPHHEAGMGQMLRDGVRALLIDIHYGFAGGERIKTDMSAEPSAEKMTAVIGADGYNAAMRIRDRLIRVNESTHGLYFCHGFCELGAYPVEPALNEVRDFAVAHPDEVIILVVEDYVTPADLASAFEKTGLAGFVFTEKPGPPWPTLRHIIESGRRILVFTESGRPGVEWLRPAFETFRETPYTFHTAEEFSCRANRGGNGGSLFQLNHWIDSTPTPKPSNAAIANAYPFLLARAQKCAAERHHLPNLIAVDFYRTGDLLAVVNKLNGVIDPGDGEQRSSDIP